MTEKSAMNIRQLDAADADAYQRLRLRALHESPAAFSASYEDEVDRSIDEVARRIRPAEDGSVRMLGVFEADRLVGFVAVVHPQRRKLRHGAALAGMYIVPESRRLGFGRALLEAAIECVRAIGGVRQIKLGVNAANVAAKALYRRAGFEIYGLEPDVLRIGGEFYDETLYVLRLGCLLKG